MSARRRIRWPAALSVAFALLAAPAAHGAAAPRYDVPPGYTRCAQATGWHGFFTWASTRHASCRTAAGFMRAYAAAIGDGATMPRTVHGYRCRIHYWRDEDGQIYASRHVCERRGAIIRYYGMV
jgi:hypothetical protein